MAPLLEARKLSKHVAIRGVGLFAKRIGTLRAVDEVSLTIAAGRCLALVGESGCGKPTLARCLALLHRPSGGSIHFDGVTISDDKTFNSNSIRRDVQVVCPDPFGARHPPRTVPAHLPDATGTPQPALPRSEARASPKKNCTPNLEPRSAAVTAESHPPPWTTPQPISSRGARYSRPIPS